MNQTVYKVVATNNKGQKVSTECNVLPDELVIHYIAKRWVKPKLGKILVFIDLKYAELFRTFGNGEVWECEAKGVEKCERLIPSSSSLEKMKTFWECDKNIYPRHLYPSRPPYGTYMAQSIKLLRPLIVDPTHLDLQTVAK